MAIADQSKWRLVATDMNGSTLTGGGPILNCAQKQFSTHLNAGKQVQFTINIDNPRANFLMSNNALIKAYRKNRLGVWQRQIVGDVIQADENGQGNVGTVTVVAADPWWRLQRRLIGMGIDSIGRGVGYTDGTILSQKDNAVLLGDILTAVNAIFPTGIQLGTVQNVGTTGYIGPVYGQNAGDMMQQLCNTLGGPELEFVPLEPSGTMPNAIICTLNVWMALGQSRPNCIFEYGTGKRNMATYDRILTKDGLCNLAYSPPPGFPSVSAHGDTMIIGQDTASQNSIGLYQDQVSSGMTSTALRQELVNEYVTVRKQARQQITFTPAVNSSQDYGVDYNLGDTVTARAWVNGTYRFNGTARVYGADFTLDENDAETVALTLIPS